MNPLLKADKTPVQNHGHSGPNGMSALKSRTTILTIEAPAVDPLSVLAMAPDSEAIYWSPPDSDTVVGLGCTAHLDSFGGSRFDTIESDAAQLFDSFIDSSAESFAPPQLFGGFSFEARQSQESLWEGFYPARFILPRLTYRLGSSGATLSLATTELNRESAQSELEEWIRRLENSARSENGNGKQSGGVMPAELRRQTPSRDDWRRIVSNIQEGIGKRGFEKVVAASRTVLEMDGPVTDHLVLRRLAEAYPGCFRFAIRIARAENTSVSAYATFLGASPERMLGKSNDHVQTEALAGSIPANSERNSGKGETETTRRLLASKKDHREHDYVVRQICDTLGKFSQNVDFSNTPEVRRLANVLHLQTPIQADLDRPTHILKLLKELHPTPAVGGTPTREALEWISDHEPGDRGWYAGMVGWFDQKGDGEFATSIRSAVIEGKRATLFAGAGIVAESKPDEEFAEAEAKLIPILTALDITR